MRKSGNTDSTAEGGAIPGGAAASAEVGAIVARLENLAEPERVPVLRGFFKTGPGEYGEDDVFLGLRVPALRQLSREYRDLPVPDAVALLHSPYHEARLLALLILVRVFEKGDASARERVFRAYLENTARINSWDLVDSSAPQIVGGYLEPGDRSVMRELASSRSLWERRIAMLATFHFIKRRDFDDALAIAEQLLDDRQDLIHKAVGWMLREIGKRDGAVEELFLRRHCRQMPRTMLRYAIEKFDSDRRRLYREGRIDELG
jgi:3-methyladenine DNA glycosylase AlkD